MAQAGSGQAYEFLGTTLGFSDSRIKTVNNDGQLIALIKNEVRTSHARHFIEYSLLSVDIWSRILPISKRTLQRKLAEKKIHKLDLNVSEVLVEMGEIYKLGLQAFENDKMRFNQWLETDNPYFNGVNPLSIMDSHRGRELVKDELLRIEHGAFA